MLKWPCLGSTGSLARRVRAAQRDAARAADRMRG
jgi:hypothetical protein